MYVIGINKFCDSFGENQITALSKRFGANSRQVLSNFLIKGHAHIVIDGNKATLVTTHYEMELTPEEEERVSKLKRGKL